MESLKPANITVDRVDYNWMIERFGNKGVRPGAGELTKRMRAYIDNLENEIAALKEATNEK